MIKNKNKKVDGKQNYKHLEYKYKDLSKYMVIYQIRNMYLLTIWKAYVIQIESLCQLQ